MLRFTCFDAVGGEDRSNLDISQTVSRYISKKINKWERNDVNGSKKVTRCSSPNLWATGP